MPGTRVTFLRRTTDESYNYKTSQLLTQPLFLSLHYCLANVLPDRCSTGPPIPGVVSHESGDYRTTSRPPNRPLRSHRALPECRYRPNWLPPTSPESPDDRRHPPTVTPELLSLRIHSHSQKYVLAFTVPLLYYPGFHRTTVILSGLSPHRCYIIQAFTVPLLYYPGFHRTAVILSGLSPYCCSMTKGITHHQGSTWTSLIIHRTQSPPTLVSRFTQHALLSI